MRKRERMEGVRKEKAMSVLVLVSDITLIPSGLCIIFMLGCESPLSFHINISKIQKKGGKRTKTS